MSRAKDLASLGDNAANLENALNNVSEDSSPQLGGDLDLVTHDVVTTSNRDIELKPHGTGKVKAPSTPMFYNFIHEESATNAATVNFTSTYITDDYDFYDVVFSDVSPNTDNSWMGMRFGISSTVYSGSDDYMYYFSHIIQRHADDSDGAGESTTSIAGYDASATSFIIHRWNEYGMGNQNGESYTARVRCFNLRSTTTYPQIKIMEGVSRMQNNYFATIYLSMGCMRNKNGADCRTDKIDYIRFFPYYSSTADNTFAGGKFSLYGGKFHE